MAPYAVEINRKTDLNTGLSSHLQRAMFARQPLNISRPVKLTRKEIIETSQRMPFLGQNVATRKIESSQRLAEVNRGLSEIRTDLRSGVERVTGTDPSLWIGNFVHSLPEGNKARVAMRGIRTDYEELIRMLSELNGSRDLSKMPEEADINKAKGLVTTLKDKTKKLEEMLFELSEQERKDEVRESIVIIEKDGILFADMTSHLEGSFGKYEDLEKFGRVVSVFARALDSYEDLIEKIEKTAIKSRLTLDANTLSKLDSAKEPFCRSAKVLSDLNLKYDLKLNSDLVTALNNIAGKANVRIDETVPGDIQNAKEENEIGLLTSIILNGYDKAIIEAIMETMKSMDKISEDVRRKIAIQMKQELKELEKFYDIVMKKKKELKQYFEMLYLEKLQIAVFELKRMINHVLAEANI